MLLYIFIEIERICDRVVIIKDGWFVMVENIYDL